MWLIQELKLTLINHHFSINQPGNPGIEPTTMKTVMKMKDLKRSDGFPTNIDRTKLVVVQIKDKAFSSVYGGAVFFSCKITGLQDFDLLPSGICEKYTEKIYIINP